MGIWKTPVDLEILNQLGHGTLVEALGIVFTEVGEDYLEARMPVDHRTRQPVGILHGGASAALAETLGSVASVLCVDDMTRQQPVGIELNISSASADAYTTGTSKSTTKKNASSPSLASPL